MNIKKANILIVEDEPQINRLIELVLLSDGFYNIKKAYSGSEAFDVIQSNKPDLILLDVMLPEIDGFTILKKIKENVYLKTIPIIILTARKEEEDILYGLENGAIDYISKPFSNKILLARIKAHLNNINLSHTTYKDISVDDLKKVVLFKGKNTNLTKFEFEILKILLSAPGTVFSRSQLLNYLRGDDGFNVSERAIDVQILNLRRKLGEFGNNILTVRGSGYKLKEIQNEKKR